VTRDRLAELLNEDLSREYQAIIAYVVYSQVLKGAEYMSIADQLELHAQHELKHALILSRQIDYFGKIPSVTPKPILTSTTSVKSSATISITRMRQSAIIASAFDNARRLENTR
jgi:bacterioferritin (cytochrome b1)